MLRTMASSRIDAKPARGRFYWTSFADLEGDSGPSDPLRFDMYTQRLGNVLLPGITNRTERVRYLSMVCAGLLQTQRMAASVRDSRRAFLPFERGWALAITLAAGGGIKVSGETSAGGRGLRPEFRGLRGANRVLRHYRTLDGVDTITPTDYILLQGQGAQGGLGAYLVTLREFGFVQSETLAVTSRGRELAHAFSPKGKHSIHLGMLCDDRGVKRRHLERLGEHVTLGAPSSAERALVREAIFDSPRSTAGEVVRRIGAAAPTAQTSVERFAAIAQPDGDVVGRAAAYAVAFDPMRIVALKLFCAMGSALVPGAATIRQVVTDSMEWDAATLRETATALSRLVAPAGLEPIAKLAHDCADAADLDETVRSVVAFHRREQRSWIVAEGTDRYRVGRHGPFEQPSEHFNGYTLGNTYRLYDDLGAVA